MNKSYQLDCFIFLFQCWQIIETDQSISTYDFNDKLNIGEEQFPGSLPFNEAGISPDNNSKSYFKFYISSVYINHSDETTRLEESVSSTTNWILFV